MRHHPDLAWSLFQNLALAVSYNYGAQTYEMLLIKEEINLAKIQAGFTAQQINLNYGK